MTLMKYIRPQTAVNAVPASDPVSRLQAEVQRLLESPFAEVGTQFFNVWAPPLDVYEDKENLVVTLEVPGMKKEDFEIALRDGVLSIGGERRLETGGSRKSGYRSERFEGRFQRSVSLPKAVEASRVRAAYKDGILTVTLPIAEAARPKQIVVGAE